MKIGGYKQSRTTDCLNARPDNLDYEVESKQPLVEQYLSDPSISAYDLMTKYGLDLDGVRNFYSRLQNDDAVKEVTNSWLYPNRNMIEVARSLMIDWVDDPEYANNILSGESVVARNLEIHATKGTCNYSCNMCLWSDKKLVTYKGLGLNDFGLMDKSDWAKVITESKELGVRRLIFSGGGEPLINKDLFGLVAMSHNIGLKTQLYSNGYSLDLANREGQDEILQMERVRFSIHSPVRDVYNRVTGVPYEKYALDVVLANIREMMLIKKSTASKTNIGIGFVVQALNCSQIKDMVELARDTGVDFIDIRQDQLGITRDLSNTEQSRVAEQLLSIRDGMSNGEYNDIEVNVSDNLMALACGVNPSDKRSKTCYTKLFRPAISPFGLVAPCDLKAEPRYWGRSYQMGDINKQQLKNILGTGGSKNLEATCTQCMPGSRTINLIISKVIQDNELGIHYTEQPFSPPINPKE